MLKIRLARIGRRNQPRFRVVVTEHTKPPKSGYIEILGNWNPVGKKLDVDEEKVKEWLDKGARMSDTVNNIFVKKKIIKGDKRRTTKEKPKKEEDEKESKEGREKKEKKDKKEKKEKEKKSKKEEEEKKEETSKEKKESKKKEKSSKKENKGSNSSKKNKNKEE